MASTHTPLRIGIMSFAHTHAIGYVEILRGMPGVELRAADPGPFHVGELRGRELADQLGVSFAESYCELLEWQPDAVIIASENARHREHVELATAAGAHILCEKPIATSWPDGLAIAEAVSSADVVFMMAYPVRYSPGYAHLKARYRAGSLGDVVSIHGRNNGKLPNDRAWFTEPALSGGGALVDHIVHIADMIDDLTDVVPQRVTAVSNRVLHRARTEVETAGLVSIEYESGLLATIDCSWSVPDEGPVWGGVELTVAGMRGTVDVDFFDTAVRGVRADTGRPIVERFGPSYDENLLRSFLDAVRAGQPRGPGLRSGLRTLATVLAAQESSRTGITVPVAQFLDPAGEVPLITTSTQQKEGSQR